MLVYEQTINNDNSARVRRVGRTLSGIDIASQGETVEAARQSLIEALELFFESADPSEVTRRLHTDVFITRVEVAVG